MLNLSQVLGAEESQNVSRGCLGLDVTASAAKDLAKDLVM